MGDAAHKATPRLPWEVQGACAHSRPGQRARRRGARRARADQEAAGGAGRNLIFFTFFLALLYWTTLMTKTHQGCFGFREQSLSVREQYFFIRRCKPAM